MTPRTVLRLALATGCLLGPPVLPAQAQINDRRPDQLEGVDVRERLDGALAVDVELFDSSGARTTLGAALGDDLPAVLTFNYSDCPMLCSMQLNGLVDSMAETGLVVGEDFRVVTVGLDPLETPERAAETRARYLEELGVGPGTEGWSFLVGDADAVRAAADSAGFGYRLVEETGEYAHAAVQIVVTPDGRVSRYLYGVDVPARDLRMALVEASQGRIGTATDAILLFCFQYDPGTGGYAFAWNTMRTGGGLTLLALALGFLWLRRSRRRHTSDEAYA